LSIWDALVDDKEAVSRVCQADMDLENLIKMGRILDIKAGWEIASMGNNHYLSWEHST
jgi:hypothetical protein